MPPIELSVNLSRTLSGQLMAVETLEKFLEIVFENYPILNIF